VTLGVSNQHSGQLAWRSSNPIESAVALHAFDTSSVIETGQLQGNTGIVVTHAEFINRLVNDDAALQTELNLFVTIDRG